MQHSVTIKWGDHIPDDEKPVETYRFDTKAELDAFMQGVEEAIGWLAHQVLEDSRNHQDPDEPLHITGGIGG